jgi:cytochrome oxidase Cu insertion factor (SCO1/SenC/PrrC family)
MALAPARRRWLAAFLLAAAAIAGATAFYLGRTPPRDDGRADAARLMSDLMAGKGVGGSFALLDSNGNTRSLADFRGSAVLLYFGFTSCPDICPTDLFAIGKAIELLGPAGADVQPVFITLDPERDAPKHIGAYASSFHPRFVALTGTESEIRKVATSYKVFFEKVTPPGSSTYTIDHTAFTFLLDREGRYAGFFPPTTTPERMAALVKEQL